MWFEEHAGAAKGVHANRRAKRICATCSVQGPCLERGIEVGIGVWAGRNFHRGMVA